MAVATVAAMPTRLSSVVFDSADPAALARFWAAATGWPITYETDDEVVVEPHEDDSGTPTEPGLPLVFGANDDPKVVKNRLHIDLNSRSDDEYAETVERVRAAGARPVDIGQTGDEDWEVLADPEGNEFCVLPPGNNFTADCGFIGALSCDGSQEVGYFWSEALGWPLVWDQDEETAIQSPLGGSKIAWGGTPLDPKPAKNRLHFDLAPPMGGDQQAEVDRLIGLGAKPIDIGQGDVEWVVMADPDGNEFCVLTPR
jgi:catechol 2,3-dioxygenase-like lactoylglutathione lyase family enzyme